jgi:hypothetical protein
MKILARALSLNLQSRLQHAGKHALKQCYPAQQAERATAPENGASVPCPSQRCELQAHWQVLFLSPLTRYMPQR